MDDEKIIIDYQSPQPRSSRAVRPVTLIESLWHIAVGIVVPIICFILSASEYPGNYNAYQSGELRTYVGLIPQAACAWPFYPLLAFAMFGLSALLVRPFAAAKNVFVRSALYSGVVLALQFTLIQTYCVFGNAMLVALILIGFVSLFFLWLARFCIVRFGQRAVALTIFAIAAFAIVITTTLIGGRSFNWWFDVFYFGLAMAPALSCSSYIWLSLIAVKLGESDQTQPRWRYYLPFAWLGTYAAAWWACIDAVLIAYSKLPKQRSGCYVVSAAANGHPWFVRSIPCVMNDGTTQPINEQLRRLKHAELMFAATCPRGHRIFRYIYDRIGPILARQIAHPVAADLAYLSLKPLEWMAILFFNTRSGRTEGARN